MKPEIPLKTADEFDGLTKWKKFLHWRSGERKQIKRGYRKRVRRWVKQKMRYI